MFENQIGKKIPKIQFSEFIFYQWPKKTRLRRAPPPSLRLKNLYIMEASITLSPDSRPAGAAELRCYGNTARWGSPCTRCLYYYLLCYRKSLMQGHYICFHFINCHYSAVLFLSEGLEGRGEWVATAACEHPRYSSLPCSDEKSERPGCGLAAEMALGGLSLHTLY